MEILLTVLIAIVIVFLIAFLRARFSYSASYDRAMYKDLKYAREHPGCSWDEAHRHRERFYRWRRL